MLNLTRLLMMMLSSLLSSFSLLILLQHCSYYCLCRAILWTAVPPSTNPRSKVNRDFLVDLSSATVVREVQDGRIWFETTAEEEEEEEVGSLRNLKARSIRLVALQSRHDIAVDDGNTDKILDENFIISSLRTQRDDDNNNVDWKKQLDSALDVWNRSGNRKAKPEEDVCFTITCQKWNSFMFPQLSSTQLCQEMSNVFIRECGWTRITKKTANNKPITYQFHLLLFDSSAILELVTFVAPPKTYLNLPKPGFRRLESFVVTKAANIIPGDVVLDPMCGKATFLIEAWTHWPHASTTYHGIDTSERQLQDAIENCQAAAPTDNSPIVHLTLGDACDLSLHYPNPDMVDKIITCPPFGRQFSETVPPRDLLKEWSRVLKTETGRIVLLVSEDILEEWVKAVFATAMLHLECVRAPFPLGPNLYVSLLVISKELKSNKQKEPQLSPSLLDWEIGTKQKGRTLWAKLRSQSLPSLVPFSENQQVP